MIFSISSMAARLLLLFAPVVCGSMELAVAAELRFLPPSLALPALLC